MINASGIIPVGHRLLIKPNEVNNMTASGIIIDVGGAADRERMMQMVGVVVAMGTTAYKDQPDAWCKVGDKITFGKYSGLMYKDKDTKDGLEYRVINDLDVVAIHEEV